MNEDHYKRLIEHVDANAKSRHPYYGPCDGFDEGACAECNKIIRDAENKIEELEANKKDILYAVARQDYAYIECVYLGYDDDGRPPK